MSRNASDTHVSLVSSGTDLPLLTRQVPHEECTMVWTLVRDGFPPLNYESELDACVALLLLPNGRVRKPDGEWLDAMDAAKVVLNRLMVGG